MSFGTWSGSVGRTDFMSDISVRRASEAEILDLLLLHKGQVQVKPQFSLRPWRRCSCVSVEKPSEYKLS